MGSPLSSIIVDIVLQDLEEKALTLLKLIPSFYLRYVDDIILVAPPSAFKHTINVFDSFYSRLQFTMEIGNNKLDFLDVTLILNNIRLTFDICITSRLSREDTIIFSHNILYLHIALIRASDQWLIK
ncbi:hypothetical protein ACFW04_012554 [Cataglyphis niger]